MSEGKRRHVPKRTCMVCGSKRAKHELYRLVLDAEDRVCLDHRQRNPGRGAYVCPSPDCLVGLRQVRLQKAFRRVLGGLAWSPASLLVENLHR
jgi:predicted RNA-binding protein YlxR (DUF448 family)